MVEFQVVESGHGLDGLVDAVTTVTQVAEHPPAFQFGDGVLGTGPAFAVPGVGPAPDDAPVRTADRGGRRRVPTVGAGRLAPGLVDGCDRWRRRHGVRGRG